MKPHERTAAAAEKVRQAAEAQTLLDLIKNVKMSTLPAPPKPYIKLCPNAPGPCYCTGACQRRRTIPDLTWNCSCPPNSICMNTACPRRIAVTC